MEILCTARDIHTWIIECTRCYIDTVRLWLPHDLSWKDQKHLRLLSPHSHYKRAKHGEKLGFSHNGGSILYGVKVTLQLPTAETLLFLASRFREGPPIQICAVDVALDWIMNTQHDADRLQRFVNAHLLKLWHRLAHGASVVGETAYIGRRRGRNTIVGYSDKPSRHDGKPCARIEWRIHGHQAVFAHGIQTIRDLLTFDHHSFWERRLRLVSVDVLRLGKLMRKKHMNAQSRTLCYGPLRYNHDLRVGCIALRAAGNQYSVDNNAVRIMHLLQWLTVHKIKNAKATLIELNPTLLLPQHSRYLKVDRAQNNDRTSTGKIQRLPTNQLPSG
jgi:hypothetical protein